MSAFRTWLAQDYVFVGDELRFQAGVLRIAPRAAQAVLTAGLAALEAELAWFETQAVRFAISLRPEADAVTRRYRDFMEESLSFGWDRCITTLWTLERAYLEAWAGAAPGGGDYKEFVEHWTAPGFAGYVESLEKALGEAGDESAFRRTAELERDFWEMAWRQA
jgi:thiaminase/transcriptional activator TenA